MAMTWRRIINTIGFIFAMGVAVYIKYGLDGSWYLAIGCAAIVFIATPFIISHVWGMYNVRPYLGVLTKELKDPIKHDKRGEPLE
jgi:hypothetical protein